jgi:hypothetical protein
MMMKVMVLQNDFGEQEYCRKRSKQLMMETNKVRVMRTEGK